jgi:probable HAF family extracellular repeat protein
LRQAKNGKRILTGTCVVTSFFKLITSLLIPALFLIEGNAWAATYKVVDLGTLIQGTATVVRGPNSAGTAVGGGSIDTATGAVRKGQGLILANGAVRGVPGFPGSDYTIAFGINDTETVVGGSNTDAAVRGFASTPAGGVRELPPLAGDSASTAFAINNSGQAVGFSSGPSGERAVIWSTSGAVTALQGSAAQTMRALAINQRKDIVGVVANSGASRRALLWPGAGALTELPMLPGYRSSEPSGINVLGNAVGYSADAAGVHHATLWSSSGAVTDLGTLPGGSFSEALGINDNGDMVGAAGSSAGARAVLWTSPNSGPQDLNNLIDPSPFVLTTAIGINNNGMIVAIGHDAGNAAGAEEQEEHEAPIRVFLLIRSGV